MTCYSGGGGAFMNIVCALSLREVLENYCWEFEFDGMVMGTEWWVLWKTSSKFNYLAQNRIDKFPMLVLELLDFTHIFCKFLISQCFILFLFRLITFSKIFFFFVLEGVSLIHGLICKICNRSLIFFSGD